MTDLASRHDTRGDSHSTKDAFPLAALIALALSGFITILTEALPAGLLPQISSDLSVSQASVGQMVTVYAIGSLVAAIPLTRATQNMRRRPLLAVTIAGFAFANLITAISTSYSLTMVARFLAGISAGLLWALLAGYAARMVPDAQKGRAIAIAMAGTPLALSIGVPAATLLGTVIGWRACFLLMSITAVLLTLWIATQLPDFQGQHSNDKQSLGQTARIPGVRPILFVTLTFVLAHNILYTYIVPLLQPAGLEHRVDAVLFLFGCVSLIGIWFVGAFVDRWLWLLAVASCLTFLLASAVMGIWPTERTGVYASVGLWGLAFAGAATIFQTAMARTAKKQTDAAQSMLVTFWNIAIAGGGLLGGGILNHLGVEAYVPVTLAFLFLCLAVIVVCHNAFRS